MTVITMDNAPESIRGECTRLLLEVKAGVFVGKISSVVREKLWEKIVASGETGGCVMIFSAPNEQGFSMVMHGNPKRRVVDIEGLQLIEMLE